jgi:hypothetical protein
MPGAMLSTSNTGGGISVMDFLLSAALEVALVGKAPDRSAAADLRLLMVVAGDEVGADDDGGGETTTPVSFTSLLALRHRRRQLMLRSSCRRWDGTQFKLNCLPTTLKSTKRHWDRRARDKSWCRIDSIDVV